MGAPRRLDFAGLAVEIVLSLSFPIRYSLVAIRCRSARTRASGRRAARWGLPALSFGSLAVGAFWFVERAFLS